MSALDVLFTPVRVGRLTFGNRLVMAPMGTCLDQGGYITDDTVAYYRRRAEGGVGAITVEGCLVSADAVGPEPRLCAPQFVPGLRRIVEAVRPYGSVVGVQLMHPGRQVVAGPSVAPSPVPLNSAAPTPHELTGPEIERIVADYAQAARFAAEAGFDYLEVHGAHGYLPSNFLSPRHNLRTDGYGGSLEKRARFSLEVARAIVAAVDLPLVWRLNGTDAEPGGFDLDSAVAVAKMLEAAGVASISVSSGTWLTLHETLAPMAVRRGHMRPLVQAVRRAVSVPVMAVGRLDDPALAAEIVASGDADLVLLGRGLIAEPDWPDLVRAGRLGEVRPCIACNACVDLVGRGERARCSVNPEVGRELTWSVEPAAAPRNVMVVGSGPSGLEAARIARLRGHRVSVWEADDALGGKLSVAGAAPSKREVLRFRDFQARRLAELGVEIRTSARVSAGTVAEERPDVVVVATGAVPLVPPVPGIDGPDVYDAQRLLRGEVEVVPGTRLVVVGGSATGCETAELMRAVGAEVTIVEMRGSIGRGIEAITRRQLVKQLRHDGVRILTKAVVVGIEPGSVRWRPAAEDTVDTAADEIIEADLVALAIGWRATGPQVAAELAADGVDVRILGDAENPADFVRAINAGADTGLAV
ncbi:FAD-dependent oxidoreductase [Amycolatopsis sp. NPDC005232]|uniref:oxidoreductase n=1 Tax=Amycolatopsis sp. NPDC005232 TaxID=3157027 RepID=UPI0033B153A4